MAAISHVFTIRRAAQILGRDEDLLWELSDQLEPEDGKLWVCDIDGAETPRLHPRWHRGSSRNYQGSDRSRRLISRRVYRGAQRMLTVLRPRLVLLRRLADLAAKQRQRLPEAVRVEVRQPGRREGAFEDRPDRTGTPPVLAVEPRRLEMPGVPDHDPGRGEQRVVVPPELLPPQVIGPFDDDVTDVVADRKEPGGERLRELRVHLPGVLVEPALIDVEVLELEGRNGPVAGAGQDREGDERAVAALDLVAARHRPDDVLDLLQRRHPRLAVRLFLCQLCFAPNRPHVLCPSRENLPRLRGRPDQQRQECLEAQQAQRCPSRTSRTSRSCASDGWRTRICSTSVGRWCSGTSCHLIARRSRAGASGWVRSRSSRCCRRASRWPTAPGRSTPKISNGLR